MAQAALTIAGTVIGSYFGYPQLGAMVGSMVGGMIAAPDLKGPRLSDSKVQISSYGSTLQRTYGVVRVAGNVIWSTDLVESATETGKGGGSQTTYSYTVSCAVAIAEGEICGIRRIWADAKLVYDARYFESGGTAQEGLEFDQSLDFAQYFQLYTGSQTQLPDPTIEAAEGVGSVEAYRGTAYVVFTDLPLGDYGNRVPNFTFEVVTQGTSTTIGDPFGEFWKMTPLGPRPAFGEATYIVANGGLDSGHDTPGLVAYEGTSYDDAYAELITQTASFYGTYVGFFTSAESTLSTFETLGALATLNTGGGAQYVYLAYNYELPEVVIENGYGTGAADSEWYADMACITSDATVGQATMTTKMPEGIVPQTASEGHTGIARMYHGGGLAEYPYNQTYASGLGFGANVVTCPEVAGYFPIIGGIMNKFIRVERVTDMSYCRTKVLLSEIVSDVCVKAGLTAGQIDVTELTDEVDGYIIPSLMPARAALEPLRQAYMFDAVESGAEIRFVKRGGASIATLTVDDIGAGKDGEAVAPVTVERAQETDLPQHVTVSYFALSADHQTGAQQSQRMATVSQQRINTQLPIVLADQTAAEIADVLMYDAWMTRVRRTVSVPMAHAYIEPTDIITVDDGEFSYVMRVVARSEQDGVITLQCVDEDIAIYSPTSTGSVTAGGGSAVRVVGATYMELLDIPIVRDTDDGAGYYVAVGGEYDTWTGSRLYRSADSGANYSAVTDITTESAIGTASTVLGDFAGGNIVDEANSVDVLLVCGSLSSTTAAGMLSGSNLFVLGDELLQARSCELIAADTYRLTGLLRGRFGTESGMSTHASGERFVVLSETTTARIASPLAQVGIEARFKPVTLGQALVDADFENFTNDARGLQPLSVVELRAGSVGGGSYLIEWTRRSRKGSRWVDYIDAPLAEESEQYRVEVTTSAGVLISTAIATTTSATVAASATNIVRVAQVSALVGPGEFAQITI
jgi:hypothetical protein